MARRPAATIVVLAWNEWPATRACLDSLRSTLSVGDQVVVVDNGSRDATPQGLARYPWVEVVTNEDNRGFAAGCNQGSAAARHEIVVFLNNDTLPVGHWLDALLEPFEDPTVGAAGSRSNFVSGPQLVADVGYGEPRRRDIAAFERTWRQDHRGQTTETDRLVGFCLAVRRRALDAVGGFDEGFGTGGYEDDDLCARLRADGHRLVIAHASYVHHEGHRTFAGNGLDFFAIQQQNQQRYLAKHGGADEHAADDDAPLLSACLIVRDEEEQLPACLASIADVVDEVVVYDTGSTDATVAIARHAGATVVEGHWDDDFGRARNAALEHCTGRWVLQVDADEELVVSGDLCAELAGAPDALVVEIDNVGVDDRQGFSHAAVRLFRRGRAEWHGRLHEHVVPANGRPPLVTSTSRTARLRHHGYAPHIVEQRGKQERNLRAALAGVEASPDGRALVDLGRALSAAGDVDAATARFDEALAGELTELDRRLALRTAANLLVEHHRPAEAMRWIDRLRPLAADDSVVRWLEGQARMALGEVTHGAALLATLDEVRDGDGWSLPPAAVLTRRAELLSRSGQWSAAFDCCVRSAELGADAVTWGFAAEAALRAGADVAPLVVDVSEPELVDVAGRLMTAAPAAADAVFEALWDRHPGAPALLAGAIRLAPGLSVERALEWSVRLRDAGLSARCPLIGLARDQRRTVDDRLRAAAVVLGSLDPDRVDELLPPIAAATAEEAFEPALLELDTLAPALLPVFVELLASSPSRCRHLSSVLAGLGAVEESAVVAELGESMKRSASSPVDTADLEEAATPGVVVLGMHRSGTSAITRVLNLLGLRVAEDDLMEADAEQNPTGFWESSSLVACNDEILADLGATWDAPPPPLTDDVVDHLVLRRGQVARAAFERNHGATGGWVWKDPRSCLTLPFWDAVLPQAPIVVLAYRNPLEVWRSLERRDGMSKAHAFALWERYLRSALAAATGRPTLVCRYTDLLDDPGAWCDRASTFLRRHGVELQAPSAPIDAIAEFLDPALRHAAAADDALGDDEDVTPAQRRLWASLEQRCGAHDAFDPGGPPAESHWVEPLLAARRAAGRSGGEATTPTPPCSIIIPLYNKVEYTEQCLESLIATTDPELFELVLVDNGSTDGTAALLDRIEGDVVIVRNPTNLGFAVACNQGARAARGEHLLFLNNDTEAHDGWLPPLLAALEDPAVAAVGSRLLFPDGTIQHAGVHVAEDRRPGAQRLVPFHRLYRAGAEHPEAMTRGAVSVLTGASLLVRRSAFFDAGGFDEGFWNGYEDVDLCLKLREAGGTLVYEPASRLVHHESVSGAERFTRTEDNVVRLVERWAGRVPVDVVIDEQGNRTSDAEAAVRPVAASGAISCENRATPVSTGR